MTEDRNLDDKALDNISGAGSTPAKKLKPNPVCSEKEIVKGGGPAGDMPEADSEGSGLPSDVSER